MNETFNLFQIGQLLLGMGFALENGSYTQYCSIGENQICFGFFLALLFFICLFYVLIGHEVAWVGREVGKN